MNNHSGILAQLITPPVARSVIPAIRAAYSLVEELKSTNEFLASVFGKETMPYIKNCAVNFVFMKYCNEGLMPFSYKIIKNGANNHSYIELIGDGCHFTVSQVQRPFDIPRESLFRNKYSLSGQVAMSENGYVDEGSCVSESIYAIFTHGWQTSTPQFINCGIPSPDMKKWEQHMNMLEVLRDLTPRTPVLPKEEIKLEFKQHIIDLMQDAE